MQTPRRHQVYSNTQAAITGNGNSGSLKNLSLSSSPYVVIVVSVKGVVSGSSPTLQVTLYAVDDAGNKSQIWQGANITATGTVQRDAVQGVVDPTFEVDWVVGGGTPSFAGVDINLYMSSPDS